MLSLCPFDIFVGVGAFVIGLGQISSFLSSDFRFALFWHSDPWPTVTSQPIRLSTNFMTLIPSLTFTDYEWFRWSICNGCGMPAGNAYPSGHLVPSPILGLANAPIVETKFLELTMSLLDFSPRIPLGTFSILPSNVNMKAASVEQVAASTVISVYTLT